MNTKPQKLSSAAYIAIVTVLVLASLNVVARLPQTSLTPFYLIAPVVGIVIFIVRPSPVFFRLTFFCAAISYGLIVGSIYGTPMPIMAAQVLHYTLVYIIWEVIWVWSRTDALFDKKSYNLVKAIFIFVACSFVLQTTIGFDFPNVADYEAQGYRTSIFFTPNDLALFLGACLALFLGGDSSGRIKVVASIAVLGIGVWGGARAGIIANALIVVAYLALRLSEVFRITKFALLAGFLIAACFLAVIAYIAIEDIREPVWRIFALEAYGTAGSVPDRTDALIFCIIEMNKMFWLGLGPGGTSYVLSMPDYKLITAESLHNAIGKLVFDLGPVFYIPFAIYVLSILITLQRRTLTAGQRSRLILLAGLPFLSLTQSAGYISNFAFWITFFIINRIR